MAKKLKVHWLNNGGHINGYFNDKVQMVLTSAAMDKQIRCPFSDGYTF